MPHQHGSDVSEELADLTRQAERAVARAQELLRENERWRDLAVQQLEHMLELGAEFRRAPKIHYP